MSETLILIVSIGFMNILCFFIGARVGQKVVNNKELNLPNPIKTIKEDIQAYEETREAVKEQERLDTIAYNIDAYDGTSIGQKEIPR